MMMLLSFVLVDSGPRHGWLSPSNYHSPCFDEEEVINESCSIRVLSLSVSLKQHLH
jgi:hypothetical protein